MYARPIMLSPHIFLYSLTGPDIPLQFFEIPVIRDRWFSVT